MLLCACLDACCRPTVLDKNSTFEDTDKTVQLEATDEATQQDPRFEQAVKHARGLCLNSKEEWDEWHGKASGYEKWKRENGMMELPQNPASVYSKVWLGWAHFLGFDARRVVYPAHIPKDIDKNHTHFVFVKSFACNVCGRPSEGGTGFCEEHQDDEGGVADEWNRRIWRDTMKVRDSLEDYLKGQRFIDLLDKYTSGIKLREMWEKKGTTPSSKEFKERDKQQQKDSKLRASKLRASVVGQGQQSPTISAPKVLKKARGATMLDRTSRCEALAMLKEGRSAAAVAEDLQREATQGKSDLAWKPPRYTHRDMKIDFLDNASRVHTLQLVIGGADRESAWNTLEILQRAVLDFITLSPIVVVEGSGGMADILAYAWRMLNDTSPVNTGLTRVGEMCTIWPL